MGTCDVLATCTCRRLKRSWPKTTSRRLGSYLTFSTSASNSKPTSSVATPSQLAKHTTNKLKKRTMDKSLQLLDLLLLCLWWWELRVRVLSRLLFFSHSPPVRVRVFCCTNTSFIV